MRFKSFVSVALLLPTAFLMGCAGMGGSPIFQVSFPAAENFLGARGALPTLSVVNTANLVGTVMVYNKNVAEIFPNEGLRAKNWYRSVPTQVPITILFHDTNDNYRGVATRIVEMGPGATSVSWVVREEDITYFGQRLQRPEHPAPPYEPGFREIEIPWPTNMEAWAQTTNDTPNDLLVRMDGRIHNKIKSGAMWGLQSEMVYPGNQNQPTLVQIFSFSADGEQLGTTEFWLNPQAWGVIAMQVVVSPSTLRR